MRDLNFLCVDKKNMQIIPRKDDSVSDEDSIDDSNDDEDHDDDDDDGDDDDDDQNQEENVGARRHDVMRATVLRLSGVVCTEKKHCKFSFVPNKSCTGQTEYSTKIYT